MQAEGHFVKMRLTTCAIGSEVYLRKKELKRRMKKRVIFVRLS